jgi:outer membrane protein assembly factor BamB
MSRLQTQQLCGASLCVALMMTACGQSPGQKLGDGDGGADSDANTDAGTVPRPDAVPQPWALLGANAQRTSQTDNIGPRQGTVETIRLANQGWVIVEAISASGRVHVWIGSEDGTGQQLALTPDGEVVWRFPREDPDASSFASPGAALTADGTLLTAGFRWPATPTPDATGVDVAFGLDADGEPGWHWRGPVSGDAPGAAPHAGVVFDESGAFYAVLGPGQHDLGDEGRFLHAFAPDGTLRWIWPRTLGFTSVPLALTPGGDVRVIHATDADPPASDEGLYALDPLTGAEQWFVDLGYRRLRHLSVNPVGRTYVTGVAPPGPAVRIIDAFGEFYGENGFNPDHYDHFTTPVASRISGGWCFGLSSHRGYDSPEPQGRIVCWAKGEFDFADLRTRGDPCGALAVDGEDWIYAVTVGNGAPTRVYALEMGESEGEVWFTVDLPTDDPNHDCTANGIRDLVYAPAIGNGRLYVGSPDGRLHIVW